MKVTLDRFEGDYAVLLVRDEETISIDFPACLLPEGCERGRSAVRSGLRGPPGGRRERRGDREGQREPGRPRGTEAHPLSTDAAMTSRWISLVPS